MKTTRYRHRWKMPNGEYQYEFDGEYWHASKDQALEWREKLVARSQKAENGDYTDYFDASWEWDIEEGEFPVFQGTKGMVILLDEEYGYRTWIWYTGMSEEELTRYWTGLESVAPFFFNPHKLDGTLIPCWLQADSKEGVWSWERGTYQEGSEDHCELDRPKPNPTYIPHKHIDGSGHIHMDDDSHLRCRRKDIFHKGYVE